MSTEFHALFSLDAERLSDRDICTMGFESRAPLPCGGYMTALSRPVDAHVTQVELRDTKAEAFLGELDDRHDLAIALGLGRDARSLDLATAVRERDGAAACGRLAGRWSLLHWNAIERRLELVGSDMALVPMYIAANPHRVAISTDLRRLARLDGVDGRLDPAGIALVLARARLRRASSEETIVRGVLQLAAGGHIVVDAQGVRVAEPRPLPPAEPWSGSYQDGVAALEALLRKVIRQHLDRHPNTALMFSGGLDSTLLAWFLATERGAGDTLTFLTSGVPRGQESEGERGSAGIVAAHLGVPLVSVRPCAAANIYAPSAGHFEAGLPLLAFGHYFMDAFYGAAREAGATSLMNGNQGELTVTNPLPLTRPDRWRRDPLRTAVRALRQYREERGQGASWPLGAFHARLAPSLLDQLPGRLAEIWRAPFAEAVPRADEAWGYRKGSRLSRTSLSMLPSSGIAMAAPFLDVRVLRLAAGMPAAFMAWQGQLRAPGLAMLHGKLPVDMGARPDHRPIFPDYHTRLQVDAPSALGRLDHFRAAGLDEWLDLDWLERNLRRVARRGPSGTAHAFEVHVTALAAEALALWHQPPDPPPR